MSLLADPLALSRHRPDLSASVPLTRVQKLLLVLLPLATLAAAVRWPMPTGLVLVGACTVFYVVFSAYKLVLAALSIRSDAELRIAPEELAALRDDELPVYSVLVPMYKEPESVAHLVDALRAMDYPDARKDVQLLLEEDDAETRAAADALDLPPWIRVTLIPPSFPRTKPKACNLGLESARGTYLVIYDAEDRPEPDQLKKAVCGFRRVPRDVVCLQSRLNFYNPRQNLLTRWFTAEYSASFDLILPGLSAADTVIPLGGTSNHFVTAALRELLGWDAYNVTEDCDLGVRIVRHGYASRMLATTTWEEACGSLPFWIRQRTRWFKGYVQTWFVHMRNPFRLLRELGLADFLHFQVIIGGVMVCVLLNPIFWALAALWFVLRMEAFTVLFPGPIFALGALCLFAGNFVFTYLGALACFRRGYYDLVLVALFAPLYWVLMSYSGWRAFLQFFSDPFHWEKTQHGARPARPGQAAS